MSQAAAASMARGALNIEVQSILLDLIDRDPDQPRQDFDLESISDLGASIEGTLGQPIQPPMLKPNPNAPGRFIIVVGERRIRAMRGEGLSEGKFLVLDDPHADTFLISLIENLHRKDLNHIEEARALQKLRLRGMSFEEIRKLTGRSQATVQAKLQLLDLPEEIQLMVRQDRLPSQSALRLRQYRETERGRLIAMAEALSRGEIPPEMAMQVKHGAKRPHAAESQIQAKLPKDLAGLLHKVAGYLAALRGLYHTVNAIQGFGPEAIARILQEQAGGETDDFLRRLAGTAGACMKLREVILGGQEQLKRSPRTSPSGARNLKVVHPRPSESEPDPEPEPEVAAPPTPAPKTNGRPVRQTIEGQEEWRINNLERQSEKPLPKVAPLPQYEPLRVREMLRAMFYNARGFVRFCLNIPELAKLTSVPRDNVKSEVVVALKVMRHYWRASPTDPKSSMGQMVVMISNIRVDSGVTTFESLLDQLIEKCSSSYDVKFDVSKL